MYVLTILLLVLSAYDICSKVNNVTAFNKTEVVETVDERLDRMERNMQMLVELVNYISRDVRKQGDQISDVNIEISQLRKQQSKQTEQLLNQRKRIYDLETKVEKFHHSKTTTTTRSTTKSVTASTTTVPTTSSTTTPSTTMLPTTSPKTTPFTTSTTTTPVHWVFYPPGTRAHRVKRFYPGFKAWFVGFGQPSNAEKVVYGGGLSFDDCLKWFAEKRSKDSQYTDMVYLWDDAWCLGHINGMGHTDFDDRLHYSFH